MDTVFEQFIKNSDNTISLTLTEDGSAISGSWTTLEIHIGDALTISRNSDADGVALDTGTGILTINPADLTEDQTPLIEGETYRVKIVLYDGGAINDGAVWGEDDDVALYFRISAKPTP